VTHTCGSIQPFDDELIPSFQTLSIIKIYSHVKRQRAGETRDFNFKNALMPSGKFIYFDKAKRKERGGEKGELLMSQARRAARLAPVISNLRFINPNSSRDKGAS